ncbi:MAG TPA: rhomboid family intramembrane serine protease, partial [Myxococcota bacterium]|nr:rhomboid family intramembrane serine protease [Myxococcota bacterium]
MVEIRNDGQTASLTMDEWEARVRAGRVAPDTEIRFGPVTGAAFRRAGDLEMFRSLYDERALASQRQLAEAPPPWMTALLVGGQIRVWWLAQLPAWSEPLAHAMVRWTSPQLEEGEAWRLVTAGVLHVDLLHAAMNLLWLGYVGWTLERALGAANLLLLFSASVVGGGLVSTLTTPASPSLGASGGVFGLIAAAVVLGVIRPHAMPERARQSLGLALLPYLLIMLLLGFTQSEVDNWAHVGGLVTGGILGGLLDLRTLERRPGWNRRVAAG